MNKHLGDDRARHAYFHIVDVDPHSASVVIRYVENDWIRGTEQTRHLSWVEFMKGLREGRYEIHRTR